MLAIPVLRSRVAPVLDWCSRIRIFPAEPSPEELARELILPHLEAAQRLKVLRDQGVEVLICGALSPALHYYAEELGFTVVSGVAGDVKEVVQSYWDNTLDHPRFRLPGYRGGCGCRGRWRGGRGALGPGLQVEPAEREVWTEPRPEDRSQVISGYVRAAAAKCLYPRSPRARR